MKKYINLLTYIVYDFSAALISALVSILLLDRELGLTWPIAWTPNLFFAVSLPCLLVFFMYVLRVYNVLWAFSSFYQFIKLSMASLAAMLVAIVVNVAIYSKSFLGLSLPIFTYCIMTALLIIQRNLVKIHFSKHDNDEKTTITGNVMIIGAGSAGQSIIKELSRYKNVKVRCAIDDDSSKHNHYILDVLIVGGRDKIISAAEKYKIDTIIFAIPSCPNDKRVEYLNICQETKCDLKLLPPLYALQDMREYHQQIRKVEIEDLLGRPPVKINVEKVAAYIKDKVVLVTGGGGTIGSELCRQIASQNPKQLIIFDVYENNAYEIQNELKYNFPKLNLITLSVRFVTVGEWTICSVPINPKLFITPRRTNMFL